MTRREDALNGAQKAVRQARGLEEEGKANEAERYWERAEALYERAGVDGEWFDHASLTDTLDETPPKMDLYWLSPTPYVVSTYEVSVEGGDPPGILAHPDDLLPIEP